MFQPGDLVVYGSNFTKNTKIFVNGEKVATSFLSPRIIRTSLDNVSDGDVITVNVLGSKSILLRAGANERIYDDPDVVSETEIPEMTESSETTESSE